MQIFQKIKVDHFVFLFVLVSLVIALCIYDDYGQSTDEPLEFQRANVALQAYSFENFDQVKKMYLDLGIVRYYGTAITAAILWVAKLVAPFVGRSYQSLVHYFYFFTFQIGVISIYYLAKNLVEEVYAFLVMLLFATQPLLWGHAFLNPKDIPIMSMILVSVTGGVFAVNRITDSISYNENLWASLKGNFQSDWRQILSKKKQRLFYTFVLYFLSLPVSIILVRQIVVWMISKAYHAPELTYLHRIFLRFSPNLNTIGLDSYIHKTSILVNRFMVGLSVLIFMLFLGWLWRKLPSFRDNLLTHLLLDFHSMSKKEIWVTIYPVIFAGMLWGIANSTRISGFVAGGMVGVYILLRLREKGILIGIGYTLIAIITSFISWPYLWFFGLKGYKQSIKLFSSFDWSGKVLFRGVLYPAKDIPRGYLLELISLQFTVPLVILAILGMGLGIWLMVKKRVNWQFYVVVYAWFLLPVLYLVFGNPTFYNNFRQYLFITPPLFLFAAIGIQSIGQRIRSKPALIVFGVITLIPGLIALVSYHPYQYVYYNQFVGGIEGAWGTYELDYMNTAYKEGMAYINKVAPEGARILVWRVEFIAETYQRNDLEIVQQSKVEDISIRDFDYGLIQNVLKIAENNLFERAVVYTVEVKDVPLLYVLDYGLLGE